MKKIKLIIIAISITILVGCSLGNTPTSRVEEYLTKYQMLDNSISTNYTNLTTDANLDRDIKQRYEKLIQKQYRNLSYEVKEEQIDGENATVTVEIEVMDYKEIINRYNKDNYELEKYHDLILKELENSKKKIIYTINFTLSKRDNDNWVVNKLTKENKEKLLGIN